ncbi:GIY-YIG nuclease family protein [Gammaproteobacteria bacterium]|nr:GIY-YIG nuclease family protein [Gammaproteobacteria bacterium]
MDGFIYILSNSAFSILKIGRTSKAPEERRKELSSETGVPAPYKIEYYAFVENYESVERQVHSKLDSNRPQKNKEHFNCSVPEAIIIIEDIANVKYKEIFYKSPEEITIERKRQEEEIIKEKVLKEKKEREIKQIEEQKEREIKQIEERKEKEIKQIEERKEKKQRDKKLKEDEYWRWLRSYFFGEPALAIFVILIFTLVLAIFMMGIFNAPPWLFWFTLIGIAIYINNFLSNYK